MPYGRHYEIRPPIQLCSGITLCLRLRGSTGIPSYAQYERALEELDALGVKRINIMVDSDYQVKEEVRQARIVYILVLSLYWYILR